MYKLIVLIVFFSLCGKAQNEFDKYDYFGSQVFTDLKLALDVEKNVYKMDLSYQKLEPKLLYAKIGKLKDLQALKLSGNEISTFPPGFSDLSNLIYFATYNNEFSEFPEFKKLGNLNYLEFLAQRSTAFPARLLT